MSHLKDKQDHFDQIGNLYGLRTWIEYGFTVQRPTGRADYRVTQYVQIERWWEIVSSAYLMVSLQFWARGSHLLQYDEDQLDLLTRFRQHRYWNEPRVKRRQQRSIADSTVYLLCSIKPWLSV